MSVLRQEAAGLRRRLTVRRIDAWRRRPSAVLVLVAIALVMRLVVVVGTPGYRPSGDPADYDRHAVAIAAVGTMAPTALAEPGGASALRPPLYPYLLGGTYRFTGARWTAARILGVLLGAMTVALVFQIAAIVLDRSVAKWAAGLAAVYPPLVWLSAGLSAENLFLPVAMAVVLALVHLHRTLALRYAAAAGVLIGLASLTRNNGIVLVVPALLAIATGRPTAGASRRAALKSSVILLAAVGVTLLPWTIRNAVEFGRLLPLGTQAGYAIAGQYNPTAAREDTFEAVWRTPDSIPSFQGLFHRPGRDEAQLDADLRSRGLDFARNNPGYVLEGLSLNARRLFDLGPNHAFTRSVSYSEMGIPVAQHAQVSRWVHLVLLLAIAGAVLFARRRRSGPLWLWSVPLLLLLSVVWLVGAPRYRVPADPFLLMLAGAALSAAWSKIRHRRSTRTRAVQSQGAAQGVQQA